MYELVRMLRIEKQIDVFVKESGGDGWIRWTSERALLQCDAIVVPTN